MKPTYFRIALILGFFLLGITAWGQTKRVSGKVISGEDGKPLPGVSITITGKSAGTQTDASGDFSIEAAEGEVLNFSYSGYTPSLITVGTAGILNISLNTVADRLGEVVVVGYGTQRRKEFAGASSTVNPLTTKFTPSSNVGTALQGTVPGVLVRQTTGAPGNTPSIAFRGGSDFDGSGSPLVVLDGVIVPSLYGIDMNDVESIDVLKDAASTAIYGARAANGVILITTKKGKKGRTQVQYTVRRTGNYIRGIGDEYLNAADYIRMNRSGIRARYLADSLDGNTANVNADKGQLTGNWGWAFGATFLNAGTGLYTTQRVTAANRQYLNDPAWKLLVDANPL